MEKTKNDGGPAFPTNRTFINGIDRHDSCQAMNYGLTKREYFAGLAMKGIADTWGDGHEKRIVEGAVKLADALIAELEKGR